MKIQFKTGNNVKQKECAKAWLDPTVTEVVYGGAKGGGKSFLGCSLILGDALMYAGTHYFIARTSLTNLRKHTIPSIYQVLDGWGITSEYYKYNGQDNYFEFYNKSKVYLLDAKYQPSDEHYYRFGSMQMTRGWIEEAGEFEPEAKSNLQASIGRWKNTEYNLPPKLLQTCNPSKNYLYSEYYKPFKEGKLKPYVRFIQAFAQDNEHLPEGYIENLERALSDAEKQRLLYGDWESENDPLVLMTYDKILEAFTNEFIVPKDPRYITADIAYEGSDIFVIGVWYDRVLKDIVAIDKIDETQIAKKIHELRIRHRVPLGNVAYDADGLKLFVRQSAKVGSLVGASPIHNHWKAINGEKYFNYKAQMYFYLAKEIEENRIYIDCKDYRKQIIEELEQIRRMQRADDNEPLRLEKKDDLRKRLGRSPDFADMIAYRMHFELMKKQGSSAQNWAAAFR